MTESGSIDMTDYVTQQVAWHEVLAVEYTLGRNASERDAWRYRYVLRYREEFHGFYLVVMAGERVRSSHRIDEQRGVISRLRMTEDQQAIILDALRRLIVDLSEPRCPPSSDEGIRDLVEVVPG